MGKIMAVNISEKKGTQKKNVHSARLMEEFGIEKDAHAGKWHRQVSLLSYEKIEEFKAKGAPIEDGAFGENLIVSGYDLRHNIDLHQCMVYSSGRIPTDMTLKVIHAGIPILSSKASPTSEAIDLAKKYHLTLICAARRDRMKVFTK